MNKNIGKSIEHILRYALAHDGKASLQDCLNASGLTEDDMMTEFFKEEIQPFGSIHYAVTDSGARTAWSDFELNDNGRKYAVRLETNVICRCLKDLVSLLLSLVQIISLTEGWISYLLGSITASLFTPVSFFALCWYPIDLIFKYLWMGCDRLKRSLWKLSSTWADSAKRWDVYFPAF